MAEKATFMTEDGVEIAGIYREAGSARGAALLLHMMPATKESWDVFAGLLESLGVSSLAIDLRGHGESRRKGSERLEYSEFTDEEHRAKILDVRAAAAWLENKTGFGDDRLAVAGASIGSNLAVRFVAERPEVKVGLALSPGLDYHGVTTGDAVASLKRGQKLMLAASEEDEYSFLSVRKLASTATPGLVVAELLKGAGHGTRMFDADPAFMRRAAQWLASGF